MACAGPLQEFYVLTDTKSSGFKNGRQVHLTVRAQVTFLHPSREGSWQGHLAILTSRVEGTLQTLGNKKQKWNRVE